MSHEARQILNENGLGVVACWCLLEFVMTSSFGRLVYIVEDLVERNCGFDTCNLAWINNDVELVFGDDGAKTGHRVVVRYFNLSQNSHSVLANQ